MSIATMLCRYVVLAAIGLGSVGSPQSTPADDAFRQFAQQINEANSALAKEEFDAAISGYEAASQLEPSREEAAYNKAIALYRKGEVVQAESLFSSIASSLDSKLAAKARFNAGNCHFAAAVQIRQQQPSAAVEHLQAAIEDYRSALSLAPSDRDARMNIELAAKLLDQLKEQQKQEQREQQQPNDDSSESDARDPSHPAPEKQNAEKQNAEKQNAEQQNAEQQNAEKRNAEKRNAEKRNAEKRNAEQRNAEQQDAEQQNADKQDSDQQDSDQSQSGQQTDSDQPLQSEQNTNQQDGEQGQSKQQNSANDASQQQQSGDEKFDSGDRSTTQEQPNSEQQSPGQQADDRPPSEQQNPKGELSAANESTESDDDVKQRHVAESVAEGEMTEQEARKMLQAIRDRDMLRRLRRQAAERSRHIPVDKDW